MNFRKKNSSALAPMGNKRFQIEALKGTQSYHVVTLGQLQDSLADLTLDDVTVDTLVAKTSIAAGSSGDAAVVDVFPATAAKGKIQISAADNAGDTTTTITNASQAAARTYTIPDAGGNANFVLTTSIGATLGARCTTQTNYTASTTLANVTGMSVNVLAAGVYGFRAYIAGTATANGGLKLAISGTATATSISYTGTHKNNATTNASTTTTTLGDAVGAATAVFTDGFIEGTIVVNAAGTLTVQAAQNASHADTSSVYVNSYFLVTRIA